MSVSDRGVAKFTPSFRCCGGSVVAACDHCLAAKQRSPTTGLPVTTACVLPIPLFLQSSRRRRPNSRFVHRSLNTKTARGDNARCHLAVSTNRTGHRTRYVFSRNQGLIGGWPILRQRHSQTGPSSWRTGFWRLRIAFLPGCRARRHLGGGRAGERKPPMHLGSDPICSSRSLSCRDGKASLSDCFFLAPHRARHGWGPCSPELLYTCPALGQPASPPGDSSRPVGLNVMIDRPIHHLPVSRRCSMRPSTHFRSYVNGCCATMMRQHKNREHSGASRCLLCAVTLRRATQQRLCI
jgi:hypothetical protein